MEPRPELVVRAIRVVRDRVGPLERGTRGVVEACRVCHFGIVGEVPVAELLDALVGDAPIEDVLAYVAPARERVRHQRADLIGRRAEPRHYDFGRAGARPASGSPGSSRCPTAQVLMTRCWP